MGKGFNNYMCKKFFHPASKENLKRVWMAQQKHEFDKKKQDDLQNQYQKEQEIYAHRALLGDTKAKVGLSFMYDAPAGAKNNREKEDGEPEYKFEWQGKFKAPREDYNKNDDTVQDQPFGIEVRNVRCIKCHKWGHMNTDKICPLFKESLTAEPPQPKDSENDLMRDLQEDGLRLKQIVMGRKNNPHAHNQQMIESDDEDPESQFLKSLSEKQKKKLLKKIEKLQGKKEKKKKKKSLDSDSDESPKKVMRHHNESDSDSEQRKHRNHHYGKNGHSSKSGHRDRSPSPPRHQDRRHKMISPENEKSRKRHHSPSPVRKHQGKVRRSESPQIRSHHSRNESPKKTRKDQDSEHEQDYRRKQKSDTHSRRQDTKRSKKLADSSDSEEDRHHKSTKSSKNYRKHQSPPRRKQSRHNSSSPEHRRR